ncbi:antibiotic biosynthesis monooxygenase [Marinilabiliaceae bacterium JC017]|nr:antibiotic biosynthesis monooxygenase [Marinilabiliaceae bacterium JC017]
MKKIVVAKFKVKETKADTFENLAQPLIEKSNMEEGCLEYQMYKNNSESDEYLFYEEYKNQEAIDYHKSSPYFESFVRDIAELLSDEISIKILNE